MNSLRQLVRKLKAQLVPPKKIKLVFSEEEIREDEPNTIWALYTLKKRA